MPVEGQRPSRTHFITSGSVEWEVIGDYYTDPNDPTKLVRDIEGHGIGSIGLVIDGGGSVPDTGFAGYVQAPWGGTITGWSIAADAAGQCVITVKKSDDASFPTTASIVASAPPTLGTASPSTDAQKAESTTLTGWTTTFSKDDWFEFTLDSVSTCTWLTLKLQITKD